MSTLGEMTMMMILIGVIMVFKLQMMVKFWKTKSSHETIRGTFNEELYRRICEIKFNQKL
jgi:hypothetical protein